MIGCGGKLRALIGPSVPRVTIKTGQIWIRLRPDKRVNSSGLLVKVRNICAKYKLLHFTIMNFNNVTRNELIFGNGAPFYHRKGEDFQLLFNVTSYFFNMT